MKFFVTGVGGQLGHDVMNELLKRGHEGVGSDIQENYSGVTDGSAVTKAPYIALDITDKDAVEKVITEVNPDAVIHCAAWTAVDMAEDDDKIAKVRAINAGGTQNIADVCKKLDCKMTYISTDYVFDGQGTEPWQPDCKDYKPLNVYGQTKLEGELAVSQTLEKYFIVRIAWVFGLNGKNFIKTIPGTMPEGRTKPWGTGQAVLAAKNVIDTPFIVINADDYYGKEGFKAVHEYLVNGGKSCMAGFVLKNTLSDNGGVTRGICKMDDQNNLTEVVETKNIVKTATGAEADGVAVDVNSLVSMNMWGLTPEFLDVLEGGFKEFFKKEVPGNPLKAEYLIPIFIGELLEQGKMSVKVLRTNDTWYGMTYHEDVAAVKDSFKKMLENGVYKADLFSDL